ncbi:sensor histidine kinase [Fulvitalea axinellae]|uniref:Sensor histidine kinase n=1 Tax=Fulvitalea axinellae TaxID=1182444 RepID=A0AAU9CPF5_9BACT|nr:sensor histidine kinase [Fulvitalea axinellae]
MKTRGKNQKIIPRILQHTLFWGIAIVLFSQLFRTSAYVNTVDYIYAALFHATLAVAVYANFGLLLPYLFDKKRYIPYALGIIVLTLAGTGLNWAFFEFVTDLLGFYFISYFEWTEIAGFFVLYLGLGTLLKFSKAQFRLGKLEKEVAEREQRHTENLLNALKSQLNPHFLFNSLNGIYSLVITDPEKAPDVIVKLSDVLRYVLYDSDCEKVSLADELRQSENYLDLQSMRADCRRAEISFEKHGDPKGFDVAPLIFLPLLENAFKHGIKGDVSDAFLRIRLERQDETLYFSIENNKGKTDGAVNRQYGGIGLENLRKRLDMLYGDAYAMEISDADTFTVRLRLPNLTEYELTMPDR